LHGSLKSLLATTAIRHLAKTATVDGGTSSHTPLVYLTPNVRCLPRFPASSPRYAAVSHLPLLWTLHQRFSYRVLPLPAMYSHTTGPPRSPSNAPRIDRSLLPPRASDRRPGPGVVSPEYSNAAGDGQVSHGPVYRHQYGGPGTSTSPRELPENDYHRSDRPGRSRVAGRGYPDNGLIRPREDYLSAEDPAPKRARTNRFSDAPRSGSYGHDQGGMDSRSRTSTNMSHPIQGRPRSASIGPETTRVFYPIYIPLLLCSSRIQVVVRIMSAAQRTVDTRRIKTNSPQNGPLSENVSNRFPATMY
jgi:hypothetical protein